MRQDTWRKIGPSIGHSKSKGPEAGLFLVSLKKRKEAGVVRMQQPIEREVREDIRR